MNDRQRIALLSFIVFAVYLPTVHGWECVAMVLILALVGAFFIMPKA